MSSNSRSTLGTGVFYISSVLFIGCVIVVFVMVGQATAESDNKEKVDKAIQTISYTTGALIVLMTLLASSYVRAYPDTRDNYMFIMTHLSLFLALLGVSISVISKRA